MSLRLSSVHRSTIRVSQQARARRRRRLWALEGLEDRVLLSGNPTVYTVTDTSDSVTDTGSLPYAITEANANGNLAGSVIAFGFTAPQTITLSSTLVLSESAGPEVIDGPSAGVVISGDNAVEVFQVDSGVTATLSGLTISGGSASSGGGIENGGELTVSGSTLSGNSATYGGETRRRRDLQRWNFDDYHQHVLEQFGLRGRGGRRDLEPAGDTGGRHQHVLGQLGPVRGGDQQRGDADGQRQHALGQLGRRRWRRDNQREGC